MYISAEQKWYPGYVRIWISCSLWVVSRSVTQVEGLVVRLGDSVRGHYHVGARVAMSVSAFTDRCVFSLTLSHYRVRFLERWQP